MARTDNFWNEREGTYLETIWPEGRDILINGLDKYLNFNEISGEAGYGIRDNGGVMEFKNEGEDWEPFGGGGVSDHGALTGLTDDDHTQYALLAGRSGGQTLNGGTASGNNLTLQSTAHATKGKIIFGSSAYDEVNDRLGIGITSPLAPFHGIRSSLGTTTADGLLLENITAAISGTQQVSPAITQIGRGYSSSFGTSRTVKFFFHVLPTQGSDASGIWKMQYQWQGDSIRDAFSYDSLAGGLGFRIVAGNSNSSPGTTRMMTLDNSGSYTWIDFLFGTVRKAAIGANSSGALRFYAQGDSYFEYYNNSSGGLFAYLFPSAFVHSSGYGAFQNGVHAGSTSANTSTLQSAGGTALKVKRITESQTLDNTATDWILDATSEYACTGSPTYACSHWTNQTDCELRDAHGGCIWDAGDPCSVFNNEAPSMGTCAGTSGCTVDTTACSGGNEGDCEAPNSVYGGTCLWTDPSDCSTFNGNEAGCAGQAGCSISFASTCSGYGDPSSCSGAGCTPVNSGDCNGLNDGGGDGTLCATQPQCSYDSGTGVCSGSYFTSCSGDNSTCSGTYGGGCTGSYNNGNCSGSYGMNCSGTSTCANIDGESDCNSEGCAWQNVMYVDLPNIFTCLDRNYWLYNGSEAGADSTLRPYGTQTIDDGEESITLQDHKDWVHIAPFVDTRSCSEFVTSGACTPSGCSITYCSWDGDSCEGSGLCSGIGDEGTCNATFSSCAGNYNYSVDWKVFGRGY